MRRSGSTSLSPSLVARHVRHGSSFRYTIIIKTTLTSFSSCPLQANGANTYINGYCNTNNNTNNNNNVSKYYNVREVSSNNSAISGLSCVAANKLTALAISPLLQHNNTTFINIPTYRHYTTNKRNVRNNNNNNMRSENYETSTKSPSQKNEPLHISPSQDDVDEEDMMMIKAPANGRRYDRFQGASSSTVSEPSYDNNNRRSHGAHHGVTNHGDNNKSQRNARNNDENVNHRRSNSRARGGHASTNTGTGSSSNNNSNNRNSNMVIVEDADGKMRAVPVSPGSSSIGNNNNNNNIPLNYSSIWPTAPPIAAKTHNSAPPIMSSASDSSKPNISHVPPPPKAPKPQKADVKPLPAVPVPLANKSQTPPRIHHPPPPPLSMSTWGNGTGSTQSSTPPPVGTHATNGSNSTIFSATSFIAGFSDIHSSTKGNGISNKNKLKYNSNRTRNSGPLASQGQSNTPMTSKSISASLFTATDTFRRIFMKESTSVEVVPIKKPLSIGVVNWNFSPQLDLVVETRCSALRNQHQDGHGDTPDTCTLDDEARLQDLMYPPMDANNLALRKAMLGAMKILTKGGAVTSENGLFNFRAKCQKDKRINGLLRQLEVLDLSCKLTLSIVRRGVSCRVEVLDPYSASGSLSDSSNNDTYTDSTSDNGWLSKNSISSSIHTPSAKIGNVNAERPLGSVGFAVCPIFLGELNFTSGVDLFNIVETALIRFLGPHIEVKSKKLKEEMGVELCEALTTGNCGSISPMKSTPLISFDWGDSNTYFDGFGYSGLYDPSLLPLPAYSLWGYIPPSPPQRWEINRVKLVSVVNNWSEMGSLSSNKEERILGIRLKVKDNCENITSYFFTSPEPLIESTWELEENNPYDDIDKSHNASSSSNSNRFNLQEDSNIVVSDKNKELSISLQKDECSISGVRVELLHHFIASLIKEPMLCLKIRELVPIVFSSPGGHLESLKMKRLYIECDTAAGNKERAPKSPRVHVLVSTNKEIANMPSHTVVSGVNSYAHRLPIYGHALISIYGADAVSAFSTLQYLAYYSNHTNSDVCATSIEAKGVLNNKESHLLTSKGIHTSSDCVDGTANSLEYYKTVHQQYERLHLLIPISSYQYPNITLSSLEEVLQYNRGVVWVAPLLSTRTKQFEKSRNSVDLCAKKQSMINQKQNNCRLIFIGNTMPHVDTAVFVERLILEGSIPEGYPLMQLLGDLSLGDADNTNKYSLLEEYHPPQEHSKLIEALKFANLRPPSRITGGDDNNNIRSREKQYQRISNNDTAPTASLSSSSGSYRNEISDSALTKFSKIDVLVMSHLKAFELNDPNVYDVGDSNVVSVPPNTSDLDSTECTMSHILEILSGGSSGNRGEVTSYHRRDEELHPLYGPILRITGHHNVMQQYCFASFINWRHMFASRRSVSKKQKSHISEDAEMLEGSDAMSDDGMTSIMKSENKRNGISADGEEYEDELSAMDDDTESEIITCKMIDIGACLQQLEADILFDTTHMRFRIIKKAVPKSSKTSAEFVGGKGKKFSGKHYNNDTPQGDEEVVLFEGSTLSGLPETIADAMGLVSVDDLPSFRILCKDKDDLPLQHPGDDDSRLQGIHSATVADKRDGKKSKVLSYKQFIRICARAYTDDDTYSISAQSCSVGMCFKTIPTGNNILSIDEESIVSGSDQYDLEGNSKYISTKAYECHKTFFKATSSLANNARSKIEGIVLKNQSNMRADDNHYGVSNYMPTGFVFCGVASPGTFKEALTDSVTRFFGPLCINGGVGHVMRVFSQELRGYNAMEPKDSSITAGPVDEEVGRNGYFFADVNLSFAAAKWGRYDDLVTSIIARRKTGETGSENEIFPVEKKGQFRFLQHPTVGLVPRLTVEQIQPMKPLQHQDTNGGKNKTDNSSSNNNTSRLMPPPRLPIMTLSLSSSFSSLVSLRQQQHWVTVASNELVEHLYSRFLFDYDISPKFSKDLVQLKIPHDINDKTIVHLSSFRGMLKRLLGSHSQCVYVPSEPQYGTLSHDSNNSDVISHDSEGTCDDNKGDISLPPTVPFSKWIITVGKIIAPQGGRITIGASSIDSNNTEAISKNYTQEDISKKILASGFPSAYEFMNSINITRHILFSTIIKQSMGWNSPSFIFSKSSNNTFIRSSSSVSPSHTVSCTFVVDSTIQRDSDKVLSHAASGNQDTVVTVSSNAIPSNGGFKRRADLEAEKLKKEAESKSNDNTDNSHSYSITTTGNNYLEAYVRCTEEIINELILYHPEILKEAHQKYRDINSNSDSSPESTTDPFIPLMNKMHRVRVDESTKRGKYMTQELSNSTSLHIKHSAGGETKRKISKLMVLPKADFESKNKAPLPNSIPPIVNKRRSLVSEKTAGFNSVYDDNNDDDDDSIPLIGSTSNVLTNSSDECDVTGDLLPPICDRKDNSNNSNNYGDDDDSYNMIDIDGDITVTKYKDNANDAPDSSFNCDVTLFDMINHHLSSLNRKCVSFHQTIEPTTDEVGEYSDNGVVSNVSTQNMTSSSDSPKFKVSLVGVTASDRQETLATIVCISDDILLTIFKLYQNAIGLTDYSSILTKVNKSIEVHKTFSGPLAKLRRHLSKKLIITENNVEYNCIDCTYWTAKIVIPLAAIGFLEDEVGDSSICIQSSKRKTKKEASMECVGRIVTATGLNLTSQATGSWAGGLLPGLLGGAESGVNDEAQDTQISNIIDLTYRSAPGISPFYSLDTGGSNGEEIFMGKPLDSITAPMAAQMLKQKSMRYTNLLDGVYSIAQLRVKRMYGTKAKLFVKVNSSPDRNGANYGNEGEGVVHPPSYDIAATSNGHITQFLNSKRTSTRNNGDGWNTNSNSNSGIDNCIEVYLAVVNDDHNDVSTGTNGSTANSQDNSLPLQPLTRLWRSNTVSLLSLVRGLATVADSFSLKDGNETKDNLGNTMSRSEPCVTDILKESSSSWEKTYFKSVTPFLANQCISKRYTGWSSMAECPNSFNIIPANVKPVLPPMFDSANHSDSSLSSSLLCSSTFDEDGDTISKDDNKLTDGIVTNTSPIKTLFTDTVTPWRGFLFGDLPSKQWIRLEYTAPLWNCHICIGGGVLSKCFSTKKKEGFQGALSTFLRHPQSIRSDTNNNNNSNNNSNIGDGGRGSGMPLLNSNIEVNPDFTTANVRMPEGEWLLTRKVLIRPSEEEPHDPYPTSVPTPMSDIISKSSTILVKNPRRAPNSQDNNNNQNNYNNNNQNNYNNNDHNSQNNYNNNNNQNSRNSPSRSRFVRPSVLPPPSPPSLL